MKLRLGRALSALLAAVLLQGVGAAQASDPERLIEALRRQVEAQGRLLRDWASLIRYGSEDTEIPPPEPGERRVVFLGDQITEEWGQGGAAFFPGKPYFNRGIALQTTPQMLVRFRQDVISLEPKAVVIHAGTNDIASVTGPSTQGMMAENFQSMIELAEAHGIKVILASILPVCDCQGVNQTQFRSAGKIIGVNGWLRDFAAEKGLVYLNYYSALAEERAFKKELTVDGHLPNDAGYRVMAELAEAAIAEALGETQ